MYLGIDLGSTYSVFSTCYIRNGTAVKLSILERYGKSVPSVVSINKEKGTVLCGNTAKNLANRKINRVFEAFKMLLPEADQNILKSRGYDEVYTPRRITKEFLNSMLKSFLKDAHDEKFEKIVICVPEIWDRAVNEKKLMTLDGRAILREILLGVDAEGKPVEDCVDVVVDAVRVVTEPEAASAYFAYNYKETNGVDFNGHILLIDYGGGTLDITLMETMPQGNGSVEVGQREVGGEGYNHPDFNNRGGARIGCAGIAYMQDVIEQTLRSSGLVSDNAVIDCTDANFTAAVRFLEGSLMDASQMECIEATFGEYEENGCFDSILDEEPLEFCEFEYGGKGVTVTYQQLFKSYKSIVADVLEEELRKINEKIKQKIGIDPTSSEQGLNDNFKIAMVGGFGSFFLVRKQVERVYNFLDEEYDHRVMRLVAGDSEAADCRERAVSLGAALIAADKIRLQKVAKYSIGIYSDTSRDDEDSGQRYDYGIVYHQVLEDPDKVYWILNNPQEGDAPENRMTFAAIHDNIRCFAIGSPDYGEKGIPLKLKKEMRERLRAVPEHGFFNCGFSINRDDVVTFHVATSKTVARLRGVTTDDVNVKIPLSSFSKMLVPTRVEELKTDEA